LGWGHAGNPPGDKGFFYPFTILGDVTEQMRIVAEEQFGPALPVLRFTVRGQHGRETVAMP